MRGGEGGMHIVTSRNLRHLDGDVLQRLGFEINADAS